MEAHAASKAKNDAGSPWSQGRASFAWQRLQTGNESGIASTTTRASIRSCLGKGYSKTRIRGGAPVLQEPPVRPGWSTASVTTASEPIQT